MSNPVGPADREQFGEFLKKWQVRLGLTDWRMPFTKKPARKGVMAEVYKMDYEARLANVRLGENFGSEPVTLHSLERTAVHESLHVLLYELRVLCQDPETPEDVINSAEHRIINTLEALLVP